MSWVIFRLFRLLRLLRSEGALNLVTVDNNIVLIKAYISAEGKNDGSPRTPVVVPQPLCNLGEFNRFRSPYIAITTGDLGEPYFYSSPTSGMWDQD